MGLQVHPTLGIRAEKNGQPQDEFIIGAVIVAVGTSVPELATTIAKRRGHDEVGLETVLGSNIFNGIFIVAIAAIIHPITVSWHEVAVILVFHTLELS